MTVSTAPTPLSYNGNDATVAFPITWKYNAKSHVVATHRSTAGVETVWVLDTDYTLTAAGDSGTLTAIVAPATGETLVITLEPPNTQLSDLPLGGDFQSSTVEDGLDLSAQRAAALEALFNRSLRVPKTDTESGDDLELPIDTDRAGMFLAFDANGVPIVAAGTSADLGPVTSFIDTLLDDANAAAARSTLGLGTAATQNTGTSGATIPLLNANNTHSGLDIFSGIFAGTIPVLTNLRLNATVGSNALTIALKGNDGNDPSATNPVYIPFRDVTSATGDMAYLPITAATSLVVSSGSTLGTTSGVPNRTWIVGFNDAGTFRLGIINCYTTSNIYHLSNDILASSTAEGGAGAADSAGVIYTGTAVSAKAMTILGYVESTQATAGTWATTPSKTQPYYIGIKLPGAIVQRALTTTGAVNTGILTIPRDDSIPLNGEGDQYMTLSITPTSARNALVIEIGAQYSNTAAQYGIGAIFQDATAAALAVRTISEFAVDRSVPFQLKHFMTAGTASSTTFNFRMGGDTAGTTTFNGEAGARKFGGALESYMSITEYMT